MRLINVIQLISLAAIWGGSFIFMRIVVPVLGPLVTADIRVLLGGFGLLVYFAIIKFDSEWRRFWKQYLVIGVVNSAIPFVLYGYAALHIPASYSVILNSSSPLFGAVFSALWLGEKFTVPRAIGLILGAAGVILITQVGTVNVDSQFSFAVMACLGAAVCYALAGVYMKRFAKGTKSKAVAGCSQVMAGLVLLPAIPFNLPQGVVTTKIVLGMLGLAILCSAVAYLLYYRLIEEVGPTKALTVTFLMPVFGMLWGFLFLDEVISFPMIAGCFLIILGTCLVLNVFSTVRAASNLSSHSSSSR